MTKIREIKELKKILERTLDQKTDKTVSWFTVRNLSAIETPLADYERAIAGSDDLKQFREQRDAILIKHAKKRDDGSPIVVEVAPGKIKVDLQNVDDYKSDLDAFLDGKEDLVEEDGDLVKKSVDLLDENVDVEFHPIHIDKIPDFAFTPREMMMMESLGIIHD